MRPEWRNARRIVVKIGSALLVERTSGHLDRAWLTALADDASALAAEGRELILVSSGAIALGRGRLGLPRGPLRLDESQAAAAVGQIALARAYEELFAERGLTVAQVLLTLGDTEERRRYLNARGTIETLVRLGVVPVVNENDTVATSEIRYGDNDRLAARVASMASADVLVLLSDIDGLYTAPPALDPSARRLEEVREITPEIEAMAGDAGTELSRGGMVTKIVAGKIALAAGAHMVIASGKERHPLRRLSEGCPSTWFIAKADPTTARKRWISGSLEPRGTLVIDDGATTALMAGKSLLPAGVRQVTGTFERGDAVVVRALDGAEIARGLVAYSSDDARRIMGRSTPAIVAELGYAGRTELVHRDNMVLTRAVQAAPRENEGT
ncbi:MAG: glutamate 5-kinase [Rhizobiales bacterium]|nr:glutamate 5-kinase [Hyphomicrobiales bacterium]